MNTFLQHNDIKIKEAFKNISFTETFTEYIRRIAGLVYNNSLDKQNLDTLLKDYNFSHVEEIKEEILDMLLAYINYILDDNFITENEARNLKLLKRFFKIKEGDFYEYRYKEVEFILNRQFELIYADNKIVPEEALHKVGLQELFDLGYDQFLELVNKEIKAAVLRGANTEELDTVFLTAYQIERIKTYRHKNILKQFVSKIFRKK